MGETPREQRDAVPVLPLDEEQGRLVELLHRAGGPLSFEELRAAGIENPAMLCYELETAGLPIARVQRPRAGAPPVVVGLELSASWPTVATAGAAARQPSAGRARSAHRVLASARRRLRGSAGARGARAARRRAAAALAVAARVSTLRERARQVPRRLARGRGAPPGGRLAVALGGLALLVAVAVGVVLSDGGGGSGRVGYLSLARPRSHASVLIAGASSPSHERRGNRARRALRRAPSASVPAAPPASAEAARLENEGHELLEEGDYTQAIGVLRAAISASGGSPQRCAEPTSEACLTYAYALYDLGRALQLAHDPAAAVPVLAERLRIDNQRPAVEQELEAARGQLDRTDAASPGSHRRRRHGTGTSGQGSAPPSREQPHSGPAPRGAGESEAEGGTRAGSGASGASGASSVTGPSGTPAAGEGQPSTPGANGADGAGGPRRGARTPPGPRS